MSVVIRDPTGQIKVLSKGADSILGNLLRDLDPENDKQDLEQIETRVKTSESLLWHAKEGLRTLLICERKLNQ